MLRYILDQGGSMFTSRVLRSPFCYRRRAWCAAQILDQFCTVWVADKYADNQRHYHKCSVRSFIHSLIGSNTKAEVAYLSPSLQNERYKDISYSRTQLKFRAELPILELQITRMFALRLADYRTHSSIVSLKTDTYKSSK